MHDYLYKEHCYTQLEYDLASPDEIRDHFIDIGREFLECGQGFFQEEATIKIFIDGKSYAVTITGSISSQKQDRGDRLYYVEDITLVTVIEISTPEPKERKNYSLPALIAATEDQYRNVLVAINNICV